MSRYVPPHARGSGAAPAKEDSRGGDRGGDRGSDRGGDRGGGDRGDRGGDRDRRAGGGYGDRDDRPRGGGGDRDDRPSRAGDERNGGGRFDGFRDEGSSRRKGEGKGDRGGERGGDRGEGGAAASAFSQRGGGGDWKRRDGRRPVEEKTEDEIFGELKTRSSAGIDFAKYDAIPVQITGNNTENIKQIERFSEAGLTDSLFDNLRRCGYDRPTPVQKNSIPIVLSGRDLMACAQTGSGKTCAFMVPCLESLLRTGPPTSGGGRRKAHPCGLVLAPTRELAAQIHVECNKFSFDTGIRCCIIYGGADMRDQRNDLEKGCDILIATPGRLTDMADRGNVSLELIQFFILDEADRMLDMGFEPQVRQIVESTGMSRQSQFARLSMMFSATFAREVQLMAQDFLNDYVFITVGRVGSASELISQQVVYAGEMRQKVKALERAIADHLPKDGLAVIFVETKRAADSLELDLFQAGVAVTAIHGDRSQSEREEALQAFKTGANPVLVATDVAARGLDIPNVALVVNFDMPKHLDDYIHRIGRTGRAGRKGTAVAFVNEKCNYLSELGNVLVEAKQDPPIWFSELCRTCARRDVGKGAGKAKRFGAQDLRMEDNGGVNSVATPSRTTTGAAPAPTPSWQTPARSPTAWGNSGADDAW